MSVGGAAVSKFGRKGINKWPKQMEGLSLYLTGGGLRLPECLGD